MVDLAIGTQDDGYSCGICVMNAIDHAIYKVPLFTNDMRHALRVSYFVKLTNYVLYDVRWPFCLFA
jgi:hypothetical protein